MNVISSFLSNLGAKKRRDLKFDEKFDNHSLHDQTHERNKDVAFDYILQDISDITLILNCYTLFNLE